MQLSEALRNQDRAMTFAARTEARISEADQSSLARFNSGQAENAITAIFGADDPLKAAGTLRNAAKKDASGKALAGLKASAVDYLIRGAQQGGQINGTKLLANVESGKNKAALRRIFSPAELTRVRQIADAFVRMDQTPSPDGVVIQSPANQLLEWVVQITAAQQGGRMGGGSMGGSLQTANIFSRRARNFLANMTNDRARQLLIDAVEDPVLMRELLTLRKPNADIPKRTRDRLSPYLTGIATQELEGAEQ